MRVRVRVRVGAHFVVVGGRWAIVVIVAALPIVAGAAAGIAYAVGVIAVHALIEGFRAGRRLING